MRTNWRYLRETYPDYTVLPESDRYADVFDAIAEALRHGAVYEPSPSEMTTLGDATGVKDPTSPLHEWILFKTPTSQVRVPSAMRYLIGVSQYYVWDDADTYTRLETPSDYVDNVVLPDTVALLKRKLVPTEEELTDLARFVVVRQPPSQTGWVGPNLGILKFFEVRSDFRPAATGTVLREALQRLHNQLNQFRDQRRGNRRVKTTQFEKNVARLGALVASFGA